MIQRQGSRPLGSGDYLNWLQNFRQIIIYLLFDKQKRGMNLQFSAITQLRVHFFTFYMSIYAYFGVRSVSIGVDFVLGVIGTLKPGLIN